MWFQKLFNKKTNKPVEEEDLGYIVSIPVCIFRDAVRVMDVPAGKYFIIDNIRLFNKDELRCSGYQRFIFKINDNNSHKVNDIICCGSIKTKIVHFKRIESQINKNNETGIPVGHMETVYDQQAEAVVEYFGDDCGLTLKDIATKYFPDMSLSNIRYVDAYRFTFNNIIPSNKHTTHSSIYPFMFPTNPIKLTSTMDEMYERN